MFLPGVGTVVRRTDGIGALRNWTRRISRLLSLNALRGGVIQSSAVPRIAAVGRRASFPLVSTCVNWPVDWLYVQQRPNASTYEIGFSPAYAYELIPPNSPIGSLRTYLPMLAS